MALRGRIAGAAAAPACVWAPRGTARAVANTRDSVSRDIVPPLSCGYAPDAWCFSSTRILRMLSLQFLRIPQEWSCRGSQEFATHSQEFVSPDSRRSGEI